jgi:feruloyl esterase
MLVFGWLANPALAQSTSDATNCAVLRKLSLPAFAMSEVSTEWIPAGPRPHQFVKGLSIVVPAHCRLQATLNRRQEVNGQPYGIGFALALPAAWNGRFLFQGGGGFNGILADPLGAGVAGGMSALARGFAVVSTDSGHRAPGNNALDASFLADQQAAIDFAYRAVERVTLVAKMIIAQHYAQPVARSYYVGCSTGGREAMLAAQRYPLEFDGVIAGAPNMRINYAVLGLDWINVQLNGVAPRGTNGQPLTREALSSTQKQAVIDGVRNACDADDGLRDGLVFNTNACRFNPKTLVCGRANGGAGCLTVAQAAALERALAGPRTSDGRHIYVPFPFDTGIADPHQGIPGILHGGFNGSSASTTDPDAARRWAEGNAASAVTDTFAWTNMTTFTSRGGKMLFYQGLSDPTFSALDVVDYYNRLADANGGADAVRAWSRLFLVPGMGHCGGGSLTTDSFDLLTPLVDWVERGVAPDQVIATRNAEPRMTRPLCPYPQYAHYTGRGDPQQAASFECRAP